MGAEMSARAARLEQIYPVAASYLTFPFYFWGEGGDSILCFAKKEVLTFQLRGSVYFAILIRHGIAKMGGGEEWVSCTTCTKYTHTILHCYNLQVYMNIIYSYKGFLESFHNLKNIREGLRFQPQGVRAVVRSVENGLVKI